ncbi:tRNA (5-methylaminomethyl-2-thiouridylate)-methyltransferase [Chlorobium limicola DSM 245]|uniref:tRNA-specific 2-thiouridylase MnmA n=1 Tax=Chlorobium limicola (strain DSM 245 / NBRC 103803 / 6330) TaxID=290315 RepID=B3EG80_CHLL2|nr:tRNA 2-thiouridine(34) synthase MnmA [Chlorobium limicola]ACD91089.1 tRNA (5-methylaminomethyl-2-thiouridylate)-methyltransferase [Chlorobium limicola DSM 245]
MKSSQAVVTGISGGVDSAVAACLLHRQGYRVTGINIRILDTPVDNPSLQPSRLVISDHPDFQIPVFSLNLSAKFFDAVIRYFRDDYLSGRTPNPCMVCNKTIKWYGLLEAARMLEAEMIATGHYARTSFSDGRYRLMKGCDPEKDQSYFLWMLSQADLSKTLLPLGALTKPEVRELARTFGVRAAEKKESQEICFVPNDDYCSYLKNSIPGLEQEVAGGEIVDADGNVLGHHRGYPFYTIGQRRGLGIPAPKPLYVTGLDARHNRIRVGGKADLECRALTASGLNWIGIEAPSSPFETAARIRYRDKESPCTVEPIGGNKATVTFETPKHGVTPGQAVVFYRSDEVLGGGFIDQTHQP